MSSNHKDDDDDGFDNPFSSSSSDDDVSASGNRQAHASLPEIQLLDWQIQQMHAQQTNDDNNKNPFSSNSSSSGSHRPQKRPRRGPQTDNLVVVPIQNAVSIQGNDQLGAPSMAGALPTAFDPTLTTGLGLASGSIFATGGKRDGDGFSSLKPPPVEGHQRSQEHVGSSATTSTTGSETRRLTPAQNHQWNQRYEELASFVREHGHGCVSADHSTTLFHWIKRQRAQKKEKLQGKPSALTEEREAMLDRIGFVWDSREAGWHERFMELLHFRNLYGHCVPANFPPNPQLAVWVKSQRRQYKLWRQGLRSSMSEDRHKKLASVGFNFAPNAP